MQAITLKQINNGSRNVMTAQEITLIYSEGEYIVHHKSLLKNKAMKFKTFKKAWEVYKKIERSL